MVSSFLNTAGKVRLDVVAVAAAVLLLDHVPGRDQVGDDAEGAAFGNVQAGRDVTQAHPGVMGDEQENPGVISQEGPAGHLDTRVRGERPGQPGSTWTTTGARAAAGATTIKPAKGWFCAP
jgi:hypothetical protein